MTKTLEPGTRCQRCGELSYVIYITRNHELLCDFCYDKEHRGGENYGEEEDLDSY